MKVKTVSVLTASLAMTILCLAVPPVFAQRHVGTFVQSPPQRNVNPLPSTVILPMSNPIAPMANPIQPMIPSPFIRYSSPTPTVVIPRGNRGDTGRDNGRENSNNRPGPRGRGGHDGRNVVYVPVGVPSYYYPPYDYYYQEPLAVPATIPGQLPGAYYPQYTNYDPAPAAPAPAPAASTPVYEPAPEFYPEPRLIINEPRPNRVIQPPAIGTSRADVVARFGQPWGIIFARGEETLYFDGLVVVMGVDGKVRQVR